MLKPEDNERLVRIGPGTPAGKLFRRYWMPAALSNELPEKDGEPLRVRLLGEDLIAYRDTNGDVGLVDAYCPHRRAPLSPSLGPISTSAPGGYWVIASSRPRRRR